MVSHGSAGKSLFGGMAASRIRVDDTGCRTSPSSPPGTAAPLLREGRLPFQGRFASVVDAGDQLASAEDLDLGAVETYLEAGVLIV